MTLVTSLQQKTELSGKVVVLLKQLSDASGFSWKDIGAKVRVNPSTLSRIANGKKKGGPQLLASLELFSELVELKKELDSIRTAQRAIQHLMGSSAPFMLSDSPNSSTAPPPEQHVPQPAYKIPVRPKKSGGRKTPPHGT